MIRTNSFHYHPYLGPTAHYIASLQAGLRHAAPPVDNTAPISRPVDAPKKLGVKTAAAAQAQGGAGRNNDSDQASSALLDAAFRLLSQPLTREIFTEASKYLEQFIQHDPTHLLAISTLADITRQLGEKSRCKELLKRWGQLEPGNAEPYLSLAEMARDESDVDAACGYYTLAEQALRASSTSERQANMRLLAVKLALHGLGQPQTNAIWQEARMALLDPATTIDECNKFLAQAGMKAHLPLPWRITLLEELCAPLADAFLAKGEYLAAHRIANNALTVALHPHTGENWARTMASIREPFARAGEQDRMLLPALNMPVGSEDLPTVALFVDYSLSGHSGIQFINELVSGVAQAPLRRFLPIVYCFDYAFPSLKENCKRWSIPLVDMNELRGKAFDEDDLRMRLIALRNHAQTNKVSTVIYLGTLEWMASLAAGIGLAPLQIYAALMCFSFESAHIDGFLAPCAFKAGWKTIDSRAWRTVPFHYLNRLPKPGTPEAATFTATADATRAKILDGRYRTILSTVGRPEKIDEEFIDVVARLLKAHPDAVFVYFGFSETAPQIVQDMLLARGIAEQCHYAGWVDTLLYSTIIDIHLDPFHIPSGYTMAETLWAGGSYVLKKGSVSDHIGMTPYLSEVADADDNDADFAQAKAIFRCPQTGENLMALASDLIEYEAMAERLIVDVAWRAKVGAAANRYMQVYFGTGEWVTRGYATHIMELLKAKRAMEM